jgi:hypothetical protein
LEVHNVAPFTSQGKLHEFGAEKPISWAKPAHFNFFTIKFTVWSHILSTGGDASSVSNPAPIFLTSKFSCLFSCNLQPNAWNWNWDSKNVGANHLDQSFWWANQKHSPAVRSHLLHSLLQVQTVTVELYWAKTIFRIQTGKCGHSSKFSVQDNTEHHWRCSNRPTTGNFPLLDLHW